MPLYLNAEQNSSPSSPELSIPDMIVKDKIVFVEGPDDEHFIKAVMKHLRIHEDVQIIRTGGVTQFPQKFQAKTKESNFKKVRNIAIIIDADSSKDGAFKMVKKTLVTNNFPAPNKHAELVKCNKQNIQIGIFIISKPGENFGMLEDLFIETQKESPIFSHADKYFYSLAENLEKYIPVTGCSRPNPEDFKYPRNESKAKARAILSGFYDDISTVGYAAQHGYIDMNAPSLDEMKKFLQSAFHSVE